MIPSSALRAALPLVLLAALSACGKDEITVATIPKEAPPSIGPALAPPGGAAEGGAALAWKAPAGWKRLPGSGMRFASFTVPAGGGEAELSVVVLPGPAGGDLANVNRWRGQMGAAALDEAGLARESKKVESAAGPLLVVDVAGAGAKAGESLSAALLSTGDQTWFFKLTGKAGVVKAARPSFLAFLKSLRPGSPS